MRVRDRAHTSNPAIWAVVLSLIIGLGVRPSFAQSVFGSFVSAFPLDAIESVIGPVFPQGGIGSTFRSEFSATMENAQVVAAKLVGERTGERDLADIMPLEGAPFRYSLNTNFRIWRFGLRSSYSFFETESMAKNLGEIDFTGLSAGLDLDLIQRRSATFGLSFDHHFIHPAMSARVDYLAPTYNQRGELLHMAAALNFTGDKPSTFGAYVRLAPAAILGIPMHVEAYYKFPLAGPFGAGSGLRQYGAWLAFRPQIYRFDLACKLGGSRTHLKFQDLPDHASVAPEKWEVDMEWEAFGVEWSVYF